MKRQFKRIRLHPHLMVLAPGYRERYYEDGKFKKELAESKLFTEKIKKDVETSYYDQDGSNNSWAYAFERVIGIRKMTHAPQHKVWVWFEIETNVSEYDVVYVMDENGKF